MSKFDNELGEMMNRYAKEFTAKGENQTMQDYVEMLDIVPSLITHAIKFYCSLNKAHKTNHPMENLIEMFALQAKRIEQDFHNHEFVHEFIKRKNDDATA